MLASTMTAPGAEPYLPVEEVARRLDLPLGILLRRVEAGDVPSRREEGPDGVRYMVRLGDLGIENPGDQRGRCASPTAATGHGQPSRAGRADTDRRCRRDRAAVVVA